MGMSREEYLTRAREFAARGVQIAHSKLNSEKVLWIRKNSDGLSAKKQAALLGVHYRTIEKVRHFETWIHIGEKS